MIDYIQLKTAAQINNLNDILGNLKRMISLLEAFGLEASRRYYYFKIAITHFWLLFLNLNFCIMLFYITYFFHDDYFVEIVLPSTF